MLEYLLFALALFGHACLLTYCLNVIYSQPYHKRLLKIVRLLVALAIFVLPFVYVWQFGVRVTPVLIASMNHPMLIPLAVYLVVVLLMAWLIFPLATVRRWLHRPPEFVQESTTTIDVAKELGHAPYGDGKHVAVAKVPFNNIFRVDFTTLTVHLPNLPAEWDGLTLLHLSDLHFYGTPSRDYYDVIVKKCVADGVPDLLLITGDIVDGKQYIDWIGPILKPLTWKEGAVAILGNHDWWQDFDAVRGEFRKLGMEVVSNRWTQVTIRGQPLTVIGHEGPWFRPPPDLSAMPEEGFRLLLSHSPDNIGWARSLQVSLMLSGHNHGGQIRVPVFGSIFVPSKYSRRYDQGTFWEPPTLLHVNRGLAGKEPLRFRCNPQVTRIVLRQS